jgi:hypothetical protein
MRREAIEIQGRVSFLASQLITDPTILGLSNGLLIDTVNFIQRLVSFIDSTYIEYKVMSYLSDVQLWELLVGFLEQIFEDLRATLSYSGCFRARTGIAAVGNHEASWGYGGISQTGF